MPPLPVVSSRAVVKALERAGYTAMPGKGSHTVMRKPGCSAITVPQRREMKRGTLRAIIRQAEITVDEFKAQL